MHDFMSKIIDYPPGADSNLGSGKGRQSGGHTVTGMAEYVGKQSGAQSQAAEPSGWRMRATSRGAALPAGRGDGEQMKTERRF